MTPPRDTAATVGNASRPMNMTSLPLPDRSSTRRAVLKKGALASGLLIGIGAASSPAAAWDYTMCPRTPGFWKRAANWLKVEYDFSGRSPIISNLAGEPVVTQQDVIEILSTPPKGDKSIIMAHHVLATKLNLIAGSDPSCVKDTLEQANQWLKDVGFWTDYDAFEFGSGQHHWTGDSEQWKDTLDDYNNERLDCGCIYADN